MPVECDVDIRLVEQEEFHAVDKLVMRHVFDIHNTPLDRIHWINLDQRCVTLRTLRK